MKIGDRVRYSKKFRNNIGIFDVTKGTVVRILDTKKPYRIEVKWDNGSTNRALETNLELTGE